MIRKVLLKYYLNKAVKYAEKRRFEDMKKSLDYMGKAVRYAPEEVREYVRLAIGYNLLCYYAHEAGIEME